jgi:DNA-binding MarR family transcriptional regulator
MEYRTIMSSPPPPPSVVALLRMAWEEAIPEVHEGLVDAGFDDVRPAYRIVLRDVLTAGLRPTELAGRLGMSKQAANDVLRELEAGGYITLVPDPDDGRAKRIVATERGTALVQTAARISGDIAGRWAARVGEQRFAAFEQVLRDLAGDAAD